MKNNTDYYLNPIVFHIIRCNIAMFNLVIFLYRLIAIASMWTVIKYHITVKLIYGEILVTYHYFCKTLSYISDIFSYLNHINSSMQRPNENTLPPCSIYFLR